MHLPTGRRGRIAARAAGRDRAPPSSPRRPSPVRRRRHCCPGRPDAAAPVACRWAGDAACRPSGRSRCRCSPSRECAADPSASECRGDRTSPVLRRSAPTGTESRRRDCRPTSRAPVAPGAPRAPASQYSESSINRHTSSRAERGESNLLHACAVRAADRLQSAHEGMGGRDLVVPVRADQQEVPHIALDHQVLEQIKRRDIEPLQIVQEQGERMLGPSEDSQKPSEHELEAALRVLWRQFRDRRAGRRQ